MADEYQQPQLHRYHEAEEEGAKKECFDQSKSTITSATADADVTTGETKDRGLFGFAGKTEEAEKKGEDELEEKTTVNDTTDEVVGKETGVEAKDRGLFGSFMGKKKAEGEEVNEVATEFEKVNVSEEPGEKKEEKKEEKKLQRSNSSSSSSSSDEEEECEGGEKKKKKKGMKEKIKEMVSGGGDQKEEKPEIKTLNKEAEEAACVEPAEVACAGAGVDQAEEKKDFVDKMEEKLPTSEPTRGTEDAPTTHPPKAGEGYTQEPEQKEKKGIFEKIKEKIPGYQNKTANN